MLDMEPTRQVALPFFSNSNVQNIEHDTNVHHATDGICYLPTVNYFLSSVNTSSYTTIMIGSFDHNARLTNEPMSMMLQPVAASKSAASTCFVSFSSVRVRGGAPDLLTQFEGNIFAVESLDKRHFKWNGLPGVEFAEHVIAPFRAGLMTVGDKNGNLYQCAERTDPGGLAGTPPAGALNPANAADALIIAEHNLRALKLFGVLCNYTDQRSESYKLFMRSYDSDGPAVWDYIQAFGTLPTPHKYTRAREETWKLLTFDKLKLPYTITGYMKYVDIIMYHARKLNKSCAHQKEKFITGLPAFMESSHTSMRHSVHVFPATYGALPRFSTAPFSATAHPNAGEDDLDKLARAYLVDFFEKASTMHGMTPEGIVNMVLSADVECVHAISADKVDAKTICFYCGGAGHGVETLLQGGKVLPCASKVLGNPPVKETQPAKAREVSETEDFSLSEMGQAINSLGEQLYSIKDQVSAIQKYKFGKRSNSKSSRKPASRANSASSANSDSGDSDEDDTSAGSEMDLTSIANMADTSKASKNRPLLTRRHQKL